MQSQEEIEKHIKNNNLIYCPLTKDWENKDDCEPCEMCEKYYDKGNNKNN